MNDRGPIHTVPCHSPMLLENAAAPGDAGDAAAISSQVCLSWLGCIFIWRYIFTSGKTVVTITASQDKQQLALHWNTGTASIFWWPFWTRVSMSWWPLGNIH